jgi:hypothetical protein
MDVTPIDVAPCGIVITMLIIYTVVFCGDRKKKQAEKAVLKSLNDNGWELRQRDSCSFTEKEQMRVFLDNMQYVKDNLYNSHLLDWGGCSGSSYRLDDPYPVSASLMKSYPPYSSPDGVYNISPDPDGMNLVMCGEHYKTVTEILREKRERRRSVVSCRYCRQLNRGSDFNCQKCGAPLS